MQEYIDRELKSLHGRSPKEARVDAIFKWNEDMRAEERAEKKKRWVIRGGEKRAVRKATRKMRKQRRNADRLRKLVLEPGPNQVIPSDATTTA